MDKNLTLIIKANQDFVRHTGDDKKINAPLLNSLYESISNVYVPLLRMVERLEADNIPCRFGLVLPPVLCNLLSDEEIQNNYLEYLGNRLELGKKELQRNADSEDIIKLINNEIEEIDCLRLDFENKYKKNLIPVFADFMRKGYIELLGTTGTELYMPHYVDLKEVISAQIECGLHAYRQCFGTVPEGFWLSDFGYTPGIDKIIRAYGYTYTILDARSVLLAETMPSSGIFYPSRTDNSLVIFARDKSTDYELFNDDGFVLNPVYRNQNRDIGYDLPLDELSPMLSEDNIRYSTGFKYWNRNYDDDTQNIYIPEEAKEQAKKDAKAFIIKRIDILNRASELLPNNSFVTNVFTLDAKKTFGKWYETIDWLEAIFRYAKEYNLTVNTCDKQCSEQYSLEKISPYYSSGFGAGYGENLLSSKNCWMMRYIHKACERMIDLSDRFSNDTGLKTRLLNLGAKELMLAQSSNLSKMINHSEFPEYAEIRFKDSINAFTAVFDSLGSNTVSTEWLTTLEAKDSVFPWMNYRIFSKKR